MTHPEITELIPQRRSMLLLDRIIDVEPGIHAIAAKAVTSVEWCYLNDRNERGTGYPVGLLLESFNQTAALLTRHDHVNIGGTGSAISILASYSDIEITGTVEPGDVMVHHVTVAGNLAGAEIFTGCTTVGGTRVMIVGRSVMVRRPPAALGIGSTAPKSATAHPECIGEK